MPAPRMAVYSAAKAFILFFSEALQHEIRDSNITISILSPGATRSDAFRKANADTSTVESSENFTDPDDVAQAGFDALMQGKKHEIIGFKNELQLGLSKLMPDSWSAAAMNKMFEDREKRSGD
jgi:short-subunit dehydrogenase